MKKSSFCVLKTSSWMLLGARSARSQDFDSQLDAYSAASSVAETPLFGGSIVFGAERPAAASLHALEEEHWYVHG